VVTIIGIPTLYNMPRYIFSIRKYKFEVHYYNLKKNIKTDSYILQFIL